MIDVGYERVVSNLNEWVRCIERECGWDDACSRTRWESTRRAGSNEPDPNGLNQHIRERIEQHMACAEWFVAYVRCMWRKVMLNPRVRWNVPDELTTPRPDAEEAAACRRGWEGVCRAAAPRREFPSGCNLRHNRGVTLKEEIDEQTAATSCSIGRRSDRSD